MDKTTVITADALIPRIWAKAGIDPTPENIEAFIKSTSERYERERLENTCSECGHSCEC